MPESILGSYVRRDFQRKVSDVVSETAAENRLAAPVIPARPLGVGSSTCLCRSCGLTFTRVSSFDGHRIGPWEDRCCLSVADLQAAGWAQNSTGRWHRPGASGWSFPGQSRGDDEDEGSDR